MRIVICRSNPVDPDPRVEKEARSLVGGGYAVQVIAWDRTAGLPGREERDGYVINRLPIRSAYATGLGNFPALARWLMGLTSWLFRHRDEFDLIHACDFDTVLPALLCKWIFGKRVVYDIFDFYADHLRKTPPWILGIIRRVDLWAVGRADAVIIVDEARRAQIKDGKPEELAVIVNSPEDAEIAPDGKRQGDLNIVYVGLLQVERGLHELLHVLRRHPSWSVDLAGFGGDEGAIREAARSLDNVHFHGRVPYQRTLQLTAGCDVSLATYDPSIKNHRYASPNKIFEAMMLAKPIIVAQGTNMDRIVEKWNCGMVIEYGNEEDLESALAQLAHDPELRVALGKNGRRAYDEKYAWHKMEERLLDVYQAVLSE